MITLKLDTSQVEAWMREAGPAFKRAAILALNRTQEEAMLAGKQEVLKSFKDRTPLFLKSIPTGQPGSPIPRDWRASEQGKLSAVIALGDGTGGASIGERRRNILEPFETGKPKFGHTMPVFIPTKAIRPNNMDLVPLALYPRNLLGKLNLDQALLGLKRGKGKHMRMGKGKSLYSYYLIQSGPNKKAYGIWERTGPGRNDARLIWAARPSVPRPGILKWIETVRPVAEERLPINMGAMIQVAIDQLNRQQIRAGEVLGRTLIGALT